MKKEFSFGDFEKGQLLQLKEDECKMLSIKVFQYYDTNVKNELNARQIKPILNDFYRIIGLKEHEVTPQEVSAYISMFHSEDRQTVTDKEHHSFVQNLMKTASGKGALDEQTKLRDLVDFDHSGHFRNENPQRIINELMQIGIKRFGETFMREQVDLLKKIYESCDLNWNREYDYQQIRPFLAKLNEPSTINAKTDEFQLSEDDMNRIFKLIDYDQKRKVSSEEILIFYLRGLLGV